MAKKKPDYAKAAKEASAAFTEMKIQCGALCGFFLGSGDRAAAMERLRCWVEIAAEHLSTEQIDQTALRIPMALDSELLARGDAEWGKWHRRWEAELVADKRERRQVQ